MPGGDRAAAAAGPAPSGGVAGGRVVRGGSFAYCGLLARVLLGLLARAAFANVALTVQLGHGGLLLGVRSHLASSCRVVSTAARRARGPDSRKREVLRSPARAPAAVGGAGVGPA